MIGRASVLSLVGAMIGLVAGCSQGTPSGASPGAPAATSSPPAASPAAAPDVTNKDFCTLVDAESLTSVAFPVSAGQPLSVGTFRFCQFPASDHARGSLPDSVMIGALPSGAAGAGEPVTVQGVTGSQVLTTSNCTLLLNTKGGTLQVVISRAGKGRGQCAIAQNVATAVLTRL